MKTVDILNCDFPPGIDAFFNTDKIAMHYFQKICDSPIVRELVDLNSSFSTEWLLVYENNFPNPELHKECRGLILQKGCHFAVSIGEYCNCKRIDYNNIWEVAL